MPPNSKCMAMHIRMDDRHVKGVDMQEWCDAHSTMRDVKVSGRSDRSNYVNISMSTWLDYGCGQRLPFGAATLAHYVNASLTLNPDILDLYVITDEPVWFENALVQYHTHNYHNPPVKFHVFPAKPKHRTSSLLAAADFWASLTIAQQCSGFVAHFGSAASRLVFKAVFSIFTSYNKCK